MKNFGTLKNNKKNIKKRYKKNMWGKLWKFSCFVLENMDQK